MSSSPTQRPGPTGFKTHDDFIIIYQSSSHHICLCLCSLESSWRSRRQQRCGWDRSARGSGGQRDGVNPSATHVTSAAGFAQQPLLPAERHRLLGSARRLHQDQTSGRRAGPQRGNGKDYVTFHIQFTSSRNCRPQSKIKRKFKMSILKFTFFTFSCRICNLIYTFLTKSVTDYRKFNR